MRRTTRLLLIWIFSTASAFPQRTFREVTIEGTIVVPVGRHPDQIVEVQIEGQGSELIASTYANSSGRFAFRNIGLEIGEIYYIRTEVEGFEPYRERLDRQLDLRVGGHTTLVLEPNVVTGSPADAETGTVDLRRLLADVPDEAVELYDEATAESERGNPEESIRRLVEALEIAPEYPEAHNHLGRQYLALGRIEEAISEFERAQELNHGWVIPIINLGTLYYQQGEAYQSAGNPQEAERLFMQAVRTLEGALSVDPLSPMARYMLGAALYQIADYSRAESMLMLALDLNPDLDGALFSLVNVYNRQSRYREAMELVTQYLERHPDSPEADSLERIRAQLERVISGPR